MGTGVQNSGQKTGEGSKRRILWYGGREMEAWWFGN